MTALQPATSRFENWLHSRRIPYVSIRDAQRALMPARCKGRKGDPGYVAPRPFHYVVYAPAGNLLVIVRPQRRADHDRETLTQWGKLFGPDFTPVIVGSPGTELEFAL